MQIIIIPHWTVYKCPSRPYICAFWQNIYGFDNVIGFRALFCVFRQHVITSYKHVDPRADSSFAPSQWETALLCNDVSHWLDASLQSAVTVEKQSNVGLVVSMRCYHHEKKNPAITKKPTIADPWSLSNIDCLNTETRYSCYDYTQ